MNTINFLFKINTVFIKRIDIMNKVELTRKQFDILSLLAEEKSTQSQRQLGEKTGHSLGTVNRVMQELTELQYVADGEITNA